MHLGLSRALKMPHWAFFADRDAGGRRKLFSSPLVHGNGSSLKNKQ